jgi:hypothetical protein
MEGSSFALAPKRLTVLAVAVALVTAGCGGQQHKASSVAKASASASADLDPGSLTGTWTGSYTCAQGKTGLRLVIHAGPNGALTATFNFYAIPGNPGVPSGSFTTTGTYSAAGLDLRQGHWISRPAGYSMLNLNAGPPAKGGTKLNGNVLYTGCTTFTVTRSTVLTIKQAAAAYLRILGPGNRLGLKWSRDIADHAPFGRLRADLLAYIAAGRLAVQQLRAIRWPPRVQPWITAMTQTFDQAAIRCAEVEAASGSTTAASLIDKTNQDCLASQNGTDPEKVRSMLGLPPLR